MDIVAPERGHPRWVRPALAAAALLVAFMVVLAAVRLPVPDRTVWVESSVVASSALALAAVASFLAGRRRTPDRPVVLGWGLGSGFVLGGLWIAEIAFNNLTPHTVSTPAARGLLDNATWVVVGGVTIAVAGVVTARTHRWRSGLRAGVWSGIGSGLGAALGGAALLAVLRSSVEDDPLMLTEWRQRGPSVDLAVYVTRETMAGVGGHLWVLGVAQGALLGIIGSWAMATGMRSAAVRDVRGDRRRAVNREC